MTLKVLKDSTHGTLTHQFGHANFTTFEFDSGSAVAIVGGEQLIEATYQKNLPNPRQSTGQRLQRASWRDAL